MQADQLVRSIELFQLLQIRLAGESLFSCPCPSPFSTRATCWSMRTRAATRTGRGTNRPPAL